jgi:hypothetical protein
MILLGIVNMLVLLVSVFFRMTTNCTSQDERGRREPATNKELGEYVDTGSIR